MELRLSIRGRRSTAQEFFTILSREIAAETKRQIAKSRLIAEYLGDSRVLDN